MSADMVLISLFLLSYIKYGLDTLERIVTTTAK